MPSLVRLTFVALLAAGLLTACGKRGHLDPPPGMEKAKAEDGEQKKEGAKPKRVPIVAPKRDLFIDGILE